MLLNTVLFIGIALTLILGASNPVLSQHASAKAMLSSRQAYLTANSAVEEAFYRIKTGINLPASFSVNLNSGSASVSTSDSGGEKTILVNSQRNTYQRNVQLKTSVGAGIDFNYGLQAGNGGVVMGGNSTIIGNVYSNGSINAVSATITGTAVAADSAPLSANQSNETPLPPTDSINFRRVSSDQDFAQSFQITETSPINKVQFYLKKTGSPANATVIIAADNGGSPNNSSIVSATLNAGLVTTNYGWTEVVFPTNPSLLSETTYWLIIRTGSQHNNNYYTIGANNSYTEGVAKTGRYGGTWNNTGLDGYFRLYTGGVSSYIGGASYPTGLFVGSSTALIGDAWSGVVKGTTAYGKIYCTDIALSTNNNKSCDTSKGKPSPEPLPFSEANIEEWKESTLIGGEMGSITYGWAGGTLGPKKINGNLTVQGGGTLVLTGPIWVTGTVTVTGGGSIELSPSYGVNSEMIIADGIITINGGGSAGSGQAGSYLFMVSTSKCPNDSGCSGASAVNISGGAGAVAVNAQSGTVSLNGGAGLNAIVANTINISGGSSVTYDAGLANPSFQSGPSGGYNIIDWIEI